MQLHGKMHSTVINALVPDVPASIAGRFMVDEAGYWKTKQEDKSEHDEIPQPELFVEAIPLPAFIPPALEEVRICFMHRGLAEREARFEAERFLSYYSRKDWHTVQGMQITDWRAAVTTWLQHKREIFHYKPHKTLTEQWLE